MANEFEIWSPALVEVLHPATVLGSPEFNWSAAFCRWVVHLGSPSPQQFGFLTRFSYIDNIGLFTVQSVGTAVTYIYTETDVKSFIYILFNDHTGDSMLMTIFSES